MLPENFPLLLCLFFFSEGKKEENFESGTIGLPNESFLQSVSPI
jgi:hypothetical protein